MCNLIVTKAGGYVSDCFPRNSQLAVMLQHARKTRRAWSVDYGHVFIVFYSHIDNNVIDNIIVRDIVCLGIPVVVVFL
jgi:hypothetical protein